MRAKNYSLVTGANRDESIFVMGQVLGERHTKEQTIIYVFGAADQIPGMLLSYAANDEKEILERGVAVHIGVTSVESTIRLLETIPYSVHVVFYMPGHFPPCHDGYGNVALGLPVMVRSDIIRRIIRNPAIDAVTIFVDEE